MGWSSDVCSSDLRRRPGTGPDRLRDTVGQDRIAERTLRLARSRDRALLRPALCRPPPSPPRGLGLRSRSHGADPVATAPHRRAGVAGGLSRSRGIGRRPLLGPSRPASPPPPPLSVLTRLTPFWSALPHRVPFRV